MSMNRVFPRQGAPSPLQQALYDLEPQTEAVEAAPEPAAEEAPETEPAAKPAARRAKKKYLRAAKSTLYDSYSKSYFFTNRATEVETPLNNWLLCQVEAGVLLECSADYSEE